MHVQGIAQGQPSRKEIEDIRRMKEHCVTARSVEHNYRL